MPSCLLSSFLFHLRNVYQCKCSYFSLGGQAGSIRHGTYALGTMRTKVNYGFAQKKVTLWFCSNWNLMSVRATSLLAWGAVGTCVRVYRGESPKLPGSALTVLPPEAPRVFSWEEGSSFHQVLPRALALSRNKGALLRKDPWVTPTPWGAHRVAKSAPRNVLVMEETCGREKTGQTCRGLCRGFGKGRSGRRSGKVRWRFRGGHG